MPQKLFYETVSPLLKSFLELLMKEEIFDVFRLVGGTALSLQLGHRKSDDIDLFTEVEYGSVDFDTIEDYLEGQFSYLDTFDSGAIGFGKSYFIGESVDSSIKLDLCYSDPFIRPVLDRDGIRLSEIDDIVAMKVDVVGRGGRKKDFWDLHELLSEYTIDQMLKLHQERYPNTHNKEGILSKFKKFEDADTDFDPVCLRGKYWELIKLDILDAL
ncbi:MAG: nucleotidyl transferase AbiEii/AbiGii toxin family protein [Bacteroidota bacterium]|nr:nucleotidyl transferase AbiEii/AbiGii toxin family protein [Bacteroidota bacterium]